MLVHDVITSAKARYVGLYVAYLHTLTGALYEALATSPSVRGQRLVRQGAEASLARFKADIATLESDLLRLIDLEPLTQVRNSAQVNEFVAVLAQELQRALVEQAQRDAAQVHHAWVEARMGVLIPSADRFQLMSTVREYVDRRMRTMVRNGARWKSERFVEVAVNHAFHRAYNESLLYWAWQRGYGRFKAVYPDARRSIEFLFSEYRSEPLQRDVFHPNSLALVEMNG